MKYDDVKRFFKLASPRNVYTIMTTSIKVILPVMWFPSHYSISLNVHCTVNNIDRKYISRLLPLYTNIRTPYPSHQSENFLPHFSPFSLYKYIVHVGGADRIFSTFSQVRGQSRRISSFCQVFVIYDVIKLIVTGPFEKKIRKILSRGFSRVQLCLSETIVIYMMRFKSRKLKITAHFKKTPIEIEEISTIPWYDCWD